MFPTPCIIVILGTQETYSAIIFFGALTLSQTWLLNWVRCQHCGQLLCQRQMSLIAPDVGPTDPITSGQGSSKKTAIQPEHHRPSDHSTAFHGHTISRIQHLTVQPDTTSDHLYPGPLD